MNLENEKKLLETIFEYLATTGNEIGDSKSAIDIFQANNCTVTDDFFVKIPVDVAKQALSNVPSSFKWWNRAGDDYIEYGRKDRKYVIGDMRSPTYYNPETQTVEPATSQALIDTVILVNHLPHIDVNGNIIATDNYNLDSANVICNTDMPMMLGAGNSHIELENLIKMALVVRESKENLSKKVSAQ